MSEPDLQEIHDTLISIAHKAGDMIRSAHPTTSASGSKKNSADLVTETDKAVEDMVSSTLRTKYPDYDFMGEETYTPGVPLSAKPTFIVDPIDGTTNFVHSHPYVCISLGLTVNRLPVVGVIYNPFTGLLYTAIKSQGAFKTSPDGTKVRLPVREEPVTKLNQALVAIEWGSDRSGENYRVKTRTFERLGASEEEGGAMVHSARSLGSAALNLCGVAEGHMDAYWEGGCWAWDVCAGWIVLTEASGMMVDGNPGNWEPRVDQRTYLAVRKGVERKVIEEFWGHVQGRMEYQH